MEIVRLQKEHCEILAELEKLCFSHPWSSGPLRTRCTTPTPILSPRWTATKILGYGGMHCTHQECYVDNIAVFGHHGKRAWAPPLCWPWSTRPSAGGRSTSPWRCAPPTGRRWAVHQAGLSGGGPPPELLQRPHRGRPYPHPAFPKGGQGMIVLGIESSCDETAAALVEDGRKILSSVVASRWRSTKSTAAWCRKSPPAPQRGHCGRGAGGPGAGPQKALPGGRHRCHLRPGAHRRAAGGG